MQHVVGCKNNYNAIVYTGEINEDEEKENTRTTAIFNGFTGKVEKIVENKIIVKFDLCDEQILFDYDTCNNLELAYAVTVHLFQGSQVENVLIGIDNGSFIMNTKELVYTALTRASKHCTLLAESSALRHAINTSSTAHKNTFLRELLTGEAI